MITHTKTLTSRPRGGYCDCGNWATHRFNGWECDRCKALRLADYAEKLRYVVEAGQQRKDWV